MNQKTAAILVMIAFILMPATATAADWQGTVDVHINCIDMRPFIREDVIIITSEDNFIIRPEGMDLKIFAQVGDYNGADTITKVTYQVTQGSTVIIPETEFTNTTVLPNTIWLMDCYEDTQLPAGVTTGDYEVKVTVYDRRNQASGTEDFTATTMPMYTIEDLEFGNVEQNVIANASFNITNNYGDDLSIVKNVTATDLQMFGDNGPYVIPADKISVTLPTQPFAPGQTVTVDVSIDLTGLNFATCEIMDGAAWDVTISYLSIPEPPVPPQPANPEGI